MEYWRPSCHCEERTHLPSLGGTWQLLSVTVRREHTYRPQELLSRKQSWELNRFETGTHCIALTFRELSVKNRLASHSRDTPAFCFLSAGHKCLL